MSTNSERALKVHPPCVICRDPVEQREGEHRWNWLARKTCSSQCNTAQQARARKKTKANRTWRPQLTESKLSGDCFASHNLALRGTGFRKLDRPATYVVGRQEVSLS